jgi:hypothetical protein
MLSAISIIKPAFPPPSLSSYVGILEQSPTFRFRNHCLHQAHPWLMDRADGRRRQFLRVGAKPPDSVYRTLSGDLNVGEEGADSFWLVMVDWEGDQSCQRKFEQKRLIQVIILHIDAHVLHVHTCRHWPFSCCVVEHICSDIGSSAG